MELRVARSLVKKFQQTYKVLLREGFEDLLQECLTHWFFVKDNPDFQEVKAHKSFMEKVITNKLFDLMKANEREKRRTLYDSVSLDQMLDGEDNLEAVEALIKTDEDIFKNLMKKEFLEAFDRALEELSFKQKQVYRLLSEEGLNVNEISRFLKIPRSTIRDEIKRMREIFRNEGLEDYLDF